jgi:hypothetical protein
MKRLKVFVVRSRRAALAGHKGEIQYHVRLCGLNNEIVFATETYKKRAHALKVASFMQGLLVTAGAFRDPIVFVNAAPGKAPKPDLSMLGYTGPQQFVGEKILPKRKKR